MSGKLIKEKARITFPKIYPEKQTAPKFSDGWLYSWKGRHNIKNIRRGDGCNTMRGAYNIPPSFQDALGGYQLHDIYHMDETTYFYQRIPDRSLATQWERGKQSKQRMTVVVCTNATGQDKVPLWFIGRYAHPHCLQNINVENLGCQYKANKGAWMTVELFSQWLQWFSTYIGCQRQVLLVLDNFSAHKPGNMTPPNIKIEFLPRNTTPRLQPSDQGIIHTLKAHSRRATLRSLLDFREQYPTTESRQYQRPSGDIRSLKFAPDIRNAMTFMTYGWNMVSQTTIAHCFSKAGICVRHKDPGIAFTDPVVEVTEIHDALKVDIAQVRSWLPNMVTTSDISNFISPDDEIIDDTEEVTLKRLTYPYPQLMEPTSDDDDSECPRLIPSIEVREALSILKLYIQQQWDPRMLSAQKDLFNLERHLSIPQLLGAQQQTPIIPYF